jgi:hypothetical protein
MSKAPKTLIEILKNENDNAKPYNLEGFRKYCWTNYHAENVEFWLAVEKFKACCETMFFNNPHLYVQEVREIIKTYITSESSFQINLPKSMVTDIELRFQASLSSKIIDKTIFDVAQEHIYNMMNQGPFLQYLKHVITQRRKTVVKNEALWFKKKTWPSFQQFFMLKTLVNRADERVNDLCSALLITALLVISITLNNNYLYLYVMLGFLMRTLCGCRLDPQAILVVIFLRPSLQEVFDGYPSDDFKPALPFRLSEFICLLWLIGAYALNLFNMVVFERAILGTMIAVTLISALFNISLTRLLQNYMETSDYEDDVEKQ